MKIILILALTATSSFCFAQTQNEINKEANEEYAASDKLLNEVYKTTISIYQSDTIFIENLKKSQRIWIQFRDAEINMKYPEYQEGTYGSIHPFCKASYLKELTDTRIETLKAWIRGTEEGEMCNGSVRVLNEIDKEQMGLASISQDSSIWLRADMKKDHRIFGYESPDVNSKKIFLFSIFTNEVENNPFNCTYGAYYDTNDMADFSLKYLSIDGLFLKIEVLKQGKQIDIMYVLKEWFVFL